jgi:hypothetical protein
VATDKLTTLIAVIHHCVEHQPDDPTARRDVPVADMADHVVGLCWTAMLPFVDTHGPNSEGAREGYELQQVKGGHAAMWTNRGAVRGRRSPEPFGGRAR